MPDENSQAAAIVNQATDLLPVPAVAHKVLQLMQSDDTAETDIEEAIAADPALSARILKIANSALFGRRTAASTIGQSIACLGPRTVRSVVFAASMRSVYSTPRLADHLLWEHAMGVSLASAELAQLTGAVPADEAFTAGLLHDIGKLLFKAHDPVTHETVIQQIYNEGVSALAAEIEAFGVGHPEIGEQVLTKWGFPPELVAPVALHHAAAEDGADVPPGAHIVALADATCHHLGIGNRTADGDLALADFPSARALELAAADLNRLAEAFPDKLTEKRLLFE
jgi:putative nucleotidyltransferase with HDIG domain